MAILLHYVFFYIFLGSLEKTPPPTTHDALKLNTEAWARLHRSLLKWRWGFFLTWAQVGPKLGQLLYISLKGTVARWWFQTSNIFFIFTPNPGEMIQFDKHIFQMGWSHSLGRASQLRFSRSYNFRYTDFFGKAIFRGYNL